MADNIVSQEQLLGVIDKILIKRSIAGRCSDVQKLNGPLGIILGARRDKVNNKLIIKRKEIEPELEKIDTGFTQETLEDYAALYKEDITNIMGHYLTDELMYTIDNKYITMIKDRAIDRGTLTYTATNFKDSLYSVGQSIAIKINHGLNDLPISDNRSNRSFAIVSGNVAAVLALTTNLSDPNNPPNNEYDNSPSYMGTLAGVDYYIDYTFQTNGTNTPDEVVYGIKGNGITRGSTVITPYTREWKEILDPKDGSRNYFLFDRTGMAINPLDDYYVSETGDSGFLGKFKVDLSDLAANFDTVL